MPRTVTGLLGEQGVDAFGVDISPAFCSSVSRGCQPPCQDRRLWRSSNEGPGQPPPPAEWESRLRRHGLHLEAHTIYEIDDPSHGTRSTPARALR